ncbi:MAG TPA: ricin-type beta-trefoil lectin domain protein [Candidatus Nanopelagicales bacterium]|nr:ricin-type beta-trefoil lectin domain protein [Candidatus Nanopelagicales bacterium]
MKTVKMLVTALVATAAIPVSGCAGTSARMPSGLLAKDLGPLQPTGVQIKKAGSDTCLSWTDFGAVIVEPCDRTRSTQMWDISAPFSSSPNSHTIRPVGAPLNCLDAAFVGTGANVQIADCIASPFDPRARNQLWQLLTVADGRQYRIRNASGSARLCLQATADAGPVEFGICNDATPAHQRWELVNSPRDRLS